MSDSPGPGHLPAPVSSDEPIILDTPIFYEVIDAIGWPPLTTAVTVNLTYSAYTPKKES